jgi:DNA mismatch endonuclease (patch repair protein)
MSRIRSSGNAATELRLVFYLRSAKVSGWRRNQKILGKPDFVFPANRVAVFVDGCFWHGCPRCYRRPKSRQKYWDAKVAGNVARDRRNRARLRRLGWRVVRIWEHELVTSPAKSVMKIRRKLIEEV